MNPITVHFPESQTKHWKPLNLDAVTSIIIHHIGVSKQSVDEINNYHLYTKKWKGGAGYNSYITKSGAIYILRGDHEGAQCEGHNATSYGIACEGDYDKELFMPKPQFEALVEFVKFQKNRLKKVIGVFPHHYFGSTKCPGKHFPFTQLLADLEKTEIDAGFVNCVKILKEQGIISSPDYWLNSKDFKHEYVVLLIKNTANRICQLTGG